MQSIRAAAKPPRLMKVDGGMSKLKGSEPVKLVSSIFSADRYILAEALKEVSAKYGRIDFISTIMPFDYTGYYEKEMGRSLVRRFASFEDLIKPESLPEIKVLGNAIEEKFSDSGKRRVNIDPGYISQYHLILATGKSYAHRPYLRDGVHADLTLIYRNKTFQPLEWTYPDYAEKKVIEMFNRIREKYLLQLKLESTDYGVSYNDKKHDRIQQDRIDSGEREANC